MSTEEHWHFSDANLAVELGVLSRENQCQAPRNADRQSSDKLSESVVDSVSETTLSTKSGRKKMLSDMFTELCVLMQLSWPISVSSFLEQTLFQLTASIFCGHANTLVYAAFVAASSVGNIMGTAFIVGISTAADTLFAQYYGGCRYKEMGFALQKAILIHIPFVLIIVGVFLTSDWILILFKVDKSIAVLAGLFLKLHSLALPAEVLSVLFGKFIQCQGRVRPSVFANAIANALNALLCFLLIFYLDWGIVGASLAITFSMCSLAGVYILLLKILKVHQKTWPGFHWSVVYGWGPYVKLAIPGTIMVVSESVLFEIGSILAGTIDSHNLSVQGILYEFSTCLSMWGMGVAYAASIRVGNLLGAGDSFTVKRTAYLALLFSLIVALFLAAIVLLFRSKLAYIIISDDAVASDFATLVPYLVWCSLSDCVATVCIGILSGCGRQCIAAVSNFIGYYVITLPLSIFLMLVLGMGLKGYWIGLCVGSNLLALSLLIAIVRTDWKTETELAKKRIEKMLPSSKSTLSDYGTLIKASRAGSALSLARYSQNWNRFQSSVSLNARHRTVSRNNVGHNEVASRDFIESSARVSNPDLETPSLIEPTLDNPNINTCMDDEETVVPDVRLSRASYADSFFAQIVPFVSFHCQCLKVVYFFLGFSVFLFGLIIAVAFPVNKYSV